MQYTQDQNEKMPLIAIHGVSSGTTPFNKPYGWADAIQPYLQSTQILQCPSEETSNEAEKDAVQSGFTDYWMNTNVSGVRNDKLEFPAATIWCGDGNDGKDGTDARYNLKSLPQAWRTSAGSPARRHVDTANYLFADGHVKALPPNRIQNKRTKEDQISFAVN